MIRLAGVRNEPLDQVHRDAGSSLCGRRELVRQRTTGVTEPLEFAFLAEAFFRGAGMRDRVELSYVTPLPGAFTQPIASARRGGTRRPTGES